ncbi:hypothetical protein HRbin31_00937 [bacterium HR31]|nr:hypothetical protein HRbin31_00937 [bacterium HR31]
MALPGHHAAQGDQGRGAEPELVRAQQSRQHHVAPHLEPSVHPQAHAAAQAVGAQGPASLAQPHLPGQTRVLDGVQRGSPRAALVAADLHHVREPLRHTGGDGAHPCSGHQLHGHVRGGVHLLEVVDELGQVLDAVDVMVRRRGDEGRTGLRLPQPGDLLGDLVSQQLPALAGLAALRHLDLQLHRRPQVPRGHSEPARGDLLDGGVGPVPVGPYLPTGRILTALAAVAAHTQSVGGDGQGLVGFPGEGPVGHGGDHEPAEDVLHRLHLLQGHRRSRGADLEEVPEGLWGSGAH